MLQFVQATSKDISIIQDLAHRIWFPTFKDILTIEQIDYMLDWMYSETALIQQFREDYIFLLLKENHQFTGYCSFIKREKITTLQKIYILPEKQGQGFGKKLLQEVINRAKNSGSQKIQLNVNRYNKSISFYKSQGFRTIREEDNPIGGGFYMNDYVMEYNFLL